MEHLDQLITLKMHQLGWPLEAFVDLLMAALAGGMVGIERELRGRQAGFRTNILVAVGSAMVMIVSNRMAERGWPSPGKTGVQINVDPGRIAYGVMTGIGFLGAGVIIQHRGSVRGLTTAAAIWCVAAVGLAAGLSLYTLVVFGTILLVSALWALDRFERMLPKLRWRDIVIRRRWTEGCIADTVQRLEDADVRVSDVNFNRTDHLKSVDIGARIAFSEKHLPYNLAERLEGDKTLEVLSLGEE